MSTDTITPDLQPQMPQIQQGQEPTPDDPNKASPDENAQSSELTKDEREALMKLRRDYKLGWAPDRRERIKKVLKAFEALKGNTAMAFDPDGFNYYDPFQGDSGAEDLEMYRYNNNIYQAFCLSFLAALSPEVPKVRYMPEDAQDELDLATARRASTMMAIIERKNNIKSLQKQELLHLWTGGCYFSYVRYIVDSDRNGITKEPIIQPVDTQVTPDRYMCPECGAATPADQSGMWSQATCSQCGARLTDEDFYPGETLPVPQEVGKEDVPNGGTRINIYGLLNVDCAPYANDLFETPILDLEMETDIAAIRANYEGAWTELRNSAGSASTPESDADRTARIMTVSATNSRSGFVNANLITYSRCWIQSWAFNAIDDRNVVAKLKEKFPQGCKLVSAGGTKFLEAVPAKLTEDWSHCGTLRGQGLYPPAVGDALLDIQDRLNDTANIIHEHMDRNASPTVLIDADALDGASLNGKPMLPGTFTEIKRKTLGSGQPLSNLMWQPTINIDGNIYGYAQQLIVLGQLVSGIQPQLFGGGTQEGVETKGGQEQQLNTAMNRMSLFWEQIREEHAVRAENAVKCFANNMPEQVRNVIEGDTDSGFENEYILLSEMQGSFHAYPESDQGFPMSWAEVRGQIMQLLEMANKSNSPYLDAFLNDPDNIKTICRYILPQEIKIPKDAARTKYKRLLGELAKGEPMEVLPEDAAMFGIVTDVPVFLPQTQAGPWQPDGFDDTANLALALELAMDWGSRNFKARETNPQGYSNVLAFVRLISQKVAQEQIKQQVIGAQEATSGAGETKALPPGGEE